MCNVLSATCMRRDVRSVRVPSSAGAKPRIMDEEEGLN